MLFYQFTETYSMFQLQLHNGHGHNVQTLSFHLIASTFKLDEGLRGFSSLTCATLSYSNWTVDSKAISWAGLGNSFIMSFSVRQIKGLELI